jgi:DNA-binding transcriptional ArsR family regulator
MSVKKIKFDQISSAYGMVHCLKQPHRQEVIELLHKHLSMTAADIAERLGIEATLAHHHLGVLVQNGLVDVSKKSTAVARLSVRACFAISIQPETCSFQGRVSSQWD